MLNRLIETALESIMSEQGVTKLQAHIAKLDKRIQDKKHSMPLAMSEVSVLKNCIKGLNDQHQLLQEVQFIWDKNLFESKSLKCDKETQHAINISYLEDRLIEATTLKNSAEQCFIQIKNEFEESACQPEKCNFFMAPVKEKPRSADKLYE